ncbi:hypothetical protein [Pseudomonas kitaguniensis]|uniref:hypothetical protein n=1 Tax=Pseudomonas kitaguniensis TaxID=2607908 RepID=UPI003BA17BAC
MATTLIEKLEALANGKTARSQTAQLRDIYPQVENALRSGVSRKAVLDVLNEDGFNLSMQSFEKALYRIRKTLNPIGIKASSITTETKNPEKNNQPQQPKNNHPIDFKKIKDQEFDLVSLSERPNS